MLSQLNATFLPRFIAKLSTKNIPNFPKCRFCIELNEYKSPPSRPGRENRKLSAFTNKVQPSN